MSIAPWILGLSTGLHNGAACLLHGSKLIVAIQEERLTRIKRAPLPLNRPSLAIGYCLQAAGIQVADLDVIVNCSIRGPTECAGDSFAGSLIASVASPHTQLLSIPHHLGHALSAHFASGFDDAVSLVIDGGGSYGWELPEHERAAASRFGPTLCESLSIYACTPDEVRPVEKQLADMSYLSQAPRRGMRPFASLGHMFSSVAEQVFGDYFVAGKVMALASYGQPVFDDSEFVECRNGQLEFTSRIVERFAVDERWPAHQRAYDDLSASVQHALESALRDVGVAIQRLGLGPRLCYAGGVALNSVANRRVLRELFDDIHIIAAAEDSGPAIGAAYYGWRALGGGRRPQRLRTDYLGRTYERESIDAALSAAPGVAVREAADVLDATVDLLCAGRIVGWYDGGAEFGPRALGHRSILCDPRRADGKEILNSRIKFRESFRPFAPCVLDTEVAAWFDVGATTQPMEFMLEVCRFRSPLPGPDVPAAFHVDGTGRVQVLTRAMNERLYSLVQRFFAKTGVPMLINTSMNIMGEPIVETPAEALWLLYSTGLDYCVLGDRLVEKTGQSPLSLVPFKACEVKRAENGSARVRVRTPHGRYVYERLSPSLLSVLELIDGQTTGQELLAQLPGSGIGETQLIRTFTQLVRHSLIGFRPDNERAAQT